MNRCAEGRVRPPGSGRPRAGAFAVMLVVAATAAAVASPPPAPAAPLREIAHLQRFLTLAARAHPPEPPIRVLFYGQSIIGQWYAAFRDHLRRRYPDRPWQFENRALDGHLAPYLLRTAEADVYRFQPDLLVFHAYDEGAPWASYAELLRRVRQHTCADILMVGNHLAVGDALDEASLTNGLPPELWPGTAAVDYLYLPAIAEQTGAGRRFAFHVTGWVTGEDGRGTTGADFVSASGRVVIHSADWYWEAYQGGLAPGFQVRWQTRFHGSDHAEAAGPWRWIEVANGLEDGPHTLRLELQTGRIEDFPEVLIYHPAGAEAGGGPEPVLRVLRVLRGDGALRMCWPAAPDRALERCRDWQTCAPLPAAGPARFGRQEWEGATEGMAGFFRLWTAAGPAVESRREFPSLFCHV